MVTAKKAPAKKAAVKKAAAAKKAPARKSSAAKEAPAVKSPAAKKSPATKKSSATKSPAAKKSPAKKAAARRTLVEPTPGDKRYVRRDPAGKFKDVVDVGKSLSADKRTTAKKVVKPGQGDKGDVKKS